MVYRLYCFNYEFSSFYFRNKKKLCRYIRGEEEDEDEEEQ